MSDASSRQYTKLARTLENHHGSIRIIQAVATLTLLAVFIGRFASFATGVSKTVNELPYVLLIGTSGLAFVFVHYNRMTFAAWLIMLGGSSGLFLASIETPLGFYLSVSGYVIGLVMGVMILPGQQWLWLLGYDAIAICAATLINMRTPLDGWSSQSYISFGIIQLCIMVIAALAVGYLYSGVLELLRELRKGNLVHAQLHREVREKTDLLEMITENLPVRIAYFDNEQKLRFYNRAFTNAFPAFLDHAKRVEGNASNFLAYTDPDKLRQRRPYLEAAARGETAAFEINEAPVGSEPQIIKTTYVPHIENNEVVGRVSLGVDISELRETQRLLQENLEIFKLVVDNVPARIAYIDRHNTVVFVNDRVQEHLGLTVDEAVGRKTNEILSPDYLEQVSPYAHKVYETQQKVVFDAPLMLRDGTEIIERSYYFPHIINDCVEGLFTLHMDVTDIKQTEASLGKAQRLESLGVLAGGIAHDFNNLLVAMLGQNSLALAKIELRHPARRHIVQSVEASERAATLTKQMLAYSGRGAFAVGAINMNELIVNNLKLFEVSIPKSVQLVTNLAADLPLIEADTAQMQQLIMNLIINAGQAIGEHNGRITITTAVQTYTTEQGEFWEVTGDELVPGRYVSVQVQDNGVGMNAETRSKIFDPFYTTKESGTGLGLAAALGIIRGHNGGIHLYSEEGYGTVFHLLFPVIGYVVEEEEEVASLLPELEHAHTILVVDDENDIVATVADMLELKGIQTLQATRGRDAVAIYEQNRDKISLVLLDLMMPGMNGEEVFRRLRDLNPEVKVVLSSGYSEAEATRQFIGQGLADFMQKPYNFNTLISKILGILEPMPV